MPELLYTEMAPSYNVPSRVFIPIFPLAGTVRLYHTSFPEYMPAQDGVAGIILPVVFVALILFHVV